MKHNQAGFTLMELMITVAIVGILAGVALPSYHGYIMRTQRTDTMSEMDSIMAAQERFYADGSSYTIDLTDLGYPANQVQTEIYTITAQACAGMAITQCVELTAVPRAGTPHARDGDGTLVYNSIGVRERRNAAGTFGWTD